MPKSFPCQASMMEPFTHSGCCALGGSDNLPGPQQQVTAEMTGWDS